MPFNKLWILAYRDLGRNRRRSLLSLTAVALGLALLIIMNGFIAGILNESLQNSIRLRTGHLQLRARSYDDQELSLARKDLLANPDQLVKQIQSLPQVQAAAPVLWARGFLATANETAGLQLYGIDSSSPIYAPIQAGMVAGTFISPTDRNSLLIGKSLADSIGVNIGQKVSLTVVDADGRANDGLFTIIGLFNTGIPSYDEGAAFMALDKAQAFTNTPGQASAIFILLNNQNDADQIAIALRNPNLTVLTWSELNRIFLQTMQTGMAFYAILDAIVILIVAVIIANTLLMSVFERIREIGILSALGMRSGQVLKLFLLEATTLGLAGILVGMLIGLAGVAYLATVGLSIGSAAGAAGGNFALSATIHASFAFGTFLNLAVVTLLIVLLAALYPAWYAARLEPVQALHAT